MRFINLKIKNLYGYIDKNIDFNEDLNLLVGINGAGKTSILNILSWLITPSLPNLCLTEFERIELIFEFNKIQYVITCEHTESLLQYNISSSTRIKYNPLLINIQHAPSLIANNNELKSFLIERYMGLSPDDSEKETWNLIASFPNPTVIGLDRNLYTEDSNELFYQSESFKHDLNGRLRSKESPLDKVKEMLNEEYRRRKNKILNMTNSLKDSLMLSAFDGNITSKTLRSMEIKKLKISDINKAEKKLNVYLSSLERSIAKESDLVRIKNYFENIKEVTINYEDNKDDNFAELLYKLNASQFSKISKLLGDFEKFERSTHNEMKKIHEYLETLNFFLADSSKEMVFKEETSELTYNALNKRNEIVVKNKDISYLSSGEQQILILFSYIAFNSNKGQVFIIDEPELSLHIKWQENFLEKLDIITPKGTQLILATHSPILAGKRRDKSKLLLPYND